MINAIVLEVFLGISPPNTNFWALYFFRGIDWVHNHPYPAPFRPELRNPEDTRHFADDLPAEVCSFASSGRGFEGPRKTRVPRGFLDHETYYAAVDLG